MGRPDGNRGCVDVRSPGEFGVEDGQLAGLLPYRPAAGKQSSEILNDYE
jgi:hypothetical protein